MTNCKLEAINHSNIYLLFDLLRSHKTCTLPHPPPAWGGERGGLKISEKSLLGGGGQKLLFCGGEGAGSRNFEVKVKLHNTSVNSIFGITNLYTLEIFEKCIS